MNERNNWIRNYINLNQLQKYDLENNLINYNLYREYYFNYYIKGDLLLVHKDMKRN